MVNIGNLTAVELWVGSVKADFAFVGDKQVWGGGGSSVHYIDYINTNRAELVTDYTPNSNTWVEGRFRGNAVGNYFVGTTDTRWRFFNSQTTFYVDVNGMGIRISQSGWNTTEWYDINMGNCFFTCVPDSGTTLSQTGSAASTTYSTPLALGSSTYSWGGEYEEFDCAGFKIWEGNTLIRDYRPAKDANGVVCMYEEVSGTYCYPTNAGGVFLGYETIKTKVRYTAASGLPAWEGDIVGQIVGSSGQATTQIPNISSATSIEIGSKVTGIGDYAFYNCSNLSSMTMTDGIRTIGSYAFDTCTGLNEITMSNGLTSIAATSFDNCSNLSIVNWTGKTISDAYNVTDYPWGLANGTTIHCSNGDLTVGQSPVTAGWTNVKYTTASGLSDRDYDIVGELGSGSVPNKSSSEEVEIGTHVTRIGSYAF